MSNAQSETTLWTGSYATTAMASLGVLAGVVWLAVTVLGWWLCDGWLAWLIASALATVPAIVCWLVAQYRHLSLKYTLTSKLLIVEKGLLGRNRARVALLAVEDVDCQQSAMDRMFGIGKIKVLSNDRTDPTLSMAGVEDVQSVVGLLDQACTEERNRHGMVMPAAT